MKKITRVPTNISLLRKAIKDRYMTFQEVAQLMGMGRTSFLRRLNLITSFSQEDVTKLIRILDLTNTEIINIFVKEKENEDKNQRRCKEVYENVKRGTGKRPDGSL